MKLALGTAQFGLDYGITNVQGQVCPSQINKILTLAKQENINTLDTAPAYGNSEDILGKTSLCSQFNIVTKIPALKSDESCVNQYVNSSLKQLHIEKLTAVLFHQVDDIISSPLAESRFNSLIKLKQKNKISKIGISVYTPEQLEFCIKHYPIDIVQLPLNIIDQRFITTNWLKKLADIGVEVHCRSLFLQGLLLVPPEKLPSYFTPFKDYFHCFSEAALQLKVSPLSLALAIGLQHDGINKIVVGCCDDKQLSEIISAYTTAKTINEDLSSFACDNEKLVIPSNWH